MIWRREEYIAHMQGQDIGKEMFCELFGLLVSLDKEWKAQGATEDEISLKAFGWDSVLMKKVKVNPFAITGLKEKILVDNEEVRIIADSMGRTSKLCKHSATIPLPQSYPVETMDDWLKIKHWYEFDESRVDMDWLRQCKIYKEQGYLLVGELPGAFDEPRQLLGEENLCCAYYEEPEMVNDILMTIAKTSKKCYERVMDICGLDCLSIHEDLAGKSGPLAGPNQIDEFHKPYFDAIIPELKRGGCSLFSMDSDGNINAIVDNLLACGINILYPCEPGSGMDIVEMKKKYGNKIAVKGGIDKYVLMQSKEAIRRELEYKMCKETLHGGTVFALDHRIPNGVSLENYWYYVNLGRELLSLPEITPCPHVRMAF